MTTVYTGNGAYCFSNSLHMALLAAGADATWLPDPGLLECLTTMPFGKTYLPEQRVFGPGWAALEGQGAGLDFAIATLGWTCERTDDIDGGEGTGGGGPEDALRRLRDALQDGPALLGPLDFGYLTYSRASRSMGGSDHYVTAFAIEADGADGCLRVHDPAGVPHAVLPLPDLVDAWRAERIGFKRAPFTMRARFRPAHSVALDEILARTLPEARRFLHEAAQAMGPRRLGGAHALRRLAQDLRSLEVVPDATERHLLGFAFPTAARRTVDASRFAHLAGRAEAAAGLEQQARQWGAVVSAAARAQWARTANALDALAVMEEAVTRTL